MNAITLMRRLDFAKLKTSFHLYVFCSQNGRVKGSRDGVVLKTLACISKTSEKISDRKTILRAQNHH